MCGSECFSFASIGAEAACQECVVSVQYFMQAVESSRAYNCLHVAAASPPLPPSPAS